MDYNRQTAGASSRDQNELACKSDTRTEGLKAVVGLIDLTMLGAGAAIGVSIFSVLAPAAQVGGSGILLTILVAAAPMVVFALVYGFMASVLPKSGASYEWPREFIHPFVGFLVAWLRILASVGALVTLALVTVQYASAIVPLPERTTMLCLLSLIFVLNVRGIHLAARAQTIAMLLLLGSLAVYVCFGLFHANLALIGNPVSKGMLPILSATPLLISLFLGIETATEVGEEVREAKKTIPKALALAMALTLIVYGLVTFTTLGLLGPVRLAKSSAPILQAAKLAMGAWATPIILVTAVVALLKSLNALFIVFSRYLYAMARAGALPAQIGRLHPRWGTPYVAATVAFLFTCAGLALPTNLIFLFVAVSIPTILKYMSTCVSALRMIKISPQMAFKAQYSVGVRAINRLAWLGVVAAAIIFAIGFNTDWRPYALIAGWGVVGVLYWILGVPGRTMPPELKT